MTVYTHDEIDDLFEALHSRFLRVGAPETGAEPPLYYGYRMTVGPDGKPRVEEYGNARPRRAQRAGGREPPVEVIVDDEKGQVKLVAEMPGVEKSDVNLVVEDDKVGIRAERGEKRYRAEVPLRHRVDRGSAKAAYKNGILELAFKLAEPSGTRVEVE